MTRPRTTLVLCVAACAAALVATLLLVLSEPRQASTIALWGGLFSLVPALPTLFPARSRRLPTRVAALGTLALTVLSLASIGWYFLPTLGLLTTAALTAPGPEDTAP